MVEQLCVKNMYVRYSKKQNFISKDISFCIDKGQTMAIMGPSGAGKSTLLKAVLGKIPLEKDKGDIYINGQNIRDTGLACIKHQVGFVPQDDILINELSVYENLKTFHIIAIDSTYTDKEIDEKIDNVLEILNISHIKHKRVLEISGGQRKRVNLAMELINEPDILIVDEPTSGLSSLDSLELIEYLRDYAESKDKIVIFIIHQPSADIYKMFDKLLLLDGQGQTIFSGCRTYLNEVLKSREYNIFPERIMYDIENGDMIKYVKAYVGKESNIDKKPIFRSPKESLKDFFELIKRQFLVKFRDRTSQIITFLAPPILGVLIAVVFKFSPPNHDYSFVNNLLFAQFVFMMIISGIFLGLEGSSTEVIRDRGILERESLRGLSMSSYYLSKFLIIVIFALLQSALFVSVSLYILDAEQLFLPNFITMFFVIVISGTLGLFISMIAKTSVAAFKISTMLLIPQIILGGAFLPYTNMGDEIYLWEERGNQMPLLAKIVPASWAYEFAMSLNYEYCKKNGLDMNVNLEDLKLNKTDDFLSLRSSKNFPKEFLELFSLQNYQDKTFVYSGFILFTFLSFFILIGLITIRKNYIHYKWKVTISQILLFGGFIAIPLFLIKPIKESNSKIANDFKQLIKPLNYNDAKRRCEDLNMRLPTTKEIVNIYNNNNLPKSIYWTSEKYRSHKNAYWTVNFSSLKEDKKITLKEVLNSNKISVAYTPDSIKALVICIKKD